MAEELENPGLFVEQLVYMEDVTNALVNSGDQYKDLEAALIEAKELDNPNSSIRWFLSFRTTNSSFWPRSDTMMCAL